MQRPSRSTQLNSANTRIDCSAYERCNPPESSFERSGEKYVCPDTCDVFVFSMGIFQQSQPDIDPTSKEVFHSFHHRIHTYRLGGLRGIFRNGIAGRLPDEEIWLQSSHSHRTCFIRHRSIFVYSVGGQAILYLLPVCTLYNSKRAEFPRDGC